MGNIYKYHVAYKLVANITERGPSKICEGWAAVWLTRSDSSLKTRSAVPSRLLVLIKIFVSR